MYFYPENMEFTFIRLVNYFFLLSLWTLGTRLPQSAVYITLTIMSVGSLIFGTGRSSITTLWGSLKTTAFIVFPAMLRMRV